MRNFCSPLYFLSCPLCPPPNFDAGVLLFGLWAPVSELSLAIMAYHDIQLKTHTLKTIQLQGEERTRIGWIEEILNQKEGEKKKKKKRRKEIENGNLLSIFCFLVTLKGWWFTCFCSSITLDKLKTSIVIYHNVFCWMRYFWVVFETKMQPNIGVGWFFFKNLILRFLQNCDP